MQVDESQSVIDVNQKKVVEDSANMDVVSSNSTTEIAATNPIKDGFSGMNWKTFFH